MSDTVSKLRLAPRGEHIVWASSNWSDLMHQAADEIERLRKALEMAGKRLYKEGAPHSYVDDVNRVLDGEEVEYYD